VYENLVILQRLYRLSVMIFLCHPLLGT
jgi:hypothetical protein